MEYNILPPKTECTGCGACRNVCLVDAITMGYDDEYQFILPQVDKEKCINCGLCTKSCPVNNPILKNTSTPQFYSFCADDATRKNSSSGGMFSVLASYVFSKGGYVCGAAFDGNFQVKHRIISNKEELAPLCYSKYVQSNVGDCYKEIKKLLKEDNYVLFCGTPCQVAALNNVLNKEYDKLITADLLCHGVPSQSFFDKYLKEISNGKAVKNVYFRHKKFGWAANTTYVVFEDGSEYIGKIKGKNVDAYFEAFLKNMMMRDSCYDCKFCDYPRQGDFTIGDLWHSDKLDPKSNDQKGTSFVFVNNVKASKIFSEIAKSAKYYKELTVDNYAKIPNRVTPKTKPSSFRKRFLELIDEKGFIKAFNYAYYGRYDIGLVSVIGNGNIGSILTYYALYNFLADNNYSTVLIERPHSSSLKVSEKAAEFTRKWIPDYAQPIQSKDIFDMRELNQKCEQFLVGSDQVFLSSMAQARDYAYFLSWVDENKNKTGYACSFGGPMARGSVEYNRALSYYLNKFSFLSLREDDGVNFANNELKLDKEALWCIDPVFLCDKEHYMKLVHSVDVKHESEYIGAYVLIPKLPISNLIKRVKEHFDDLPVELIGEEKKILNTKVLITYNHRDIFPIEQSLETIYNSKFFVTDSFHGVCFAIIFRKDFLVIPRDFTDRFTSLLRRIGLGDRIIKGDLSNLNGALYNPIDYEKVYAELSVEIKKSGDLLLNALKNQSNNKLADMDIIMRYIKKQQEEIQELRSELKSCSDRYVNSSNVDSLKLSEMLPEEKDKIIMQLEKDNAELRRMLWKK